MVPSCTCLDEVCILDVKKICSVVGIIPHTQHSLQV
jgi:hypothetical protein